MEKPKCFGQYPDKWRYDIGEHSILEHDLEPCSRCKLSEKCEGILRDKRIDELHSKVIDFSYEIYFLKERLEKLEKKKVK